MKALLLKKASKDPEIYQRRIKFEISEVEKQGYQAYWINAFKSKKKYQSNPNCLLMPYYLKMIDIDPLLGKDDILCSTKAKNVKEYVDKHGKLPPYIKKDPDMPDIDIDCLPEARDHLKEYAASRYGDSKVCSVGTWQTYKFKSAMIDVAVALGVVKDRYEIEEFTSELPVDVDDLKDEGKSACKGIIKDADTGETSECGHLHREIVCPVCGSTDTDGPNIAKLLDEIESLKEFYLKENKEPDQKYSNKDVVEYALALVGRIRNMGMHAGALIVSDRDLFGNIPLAKSTNKGFWYSMWSEGRNTQLSKFGYVKWDFLGLKTQAYIKNCCDLIYKNRGISFGKLLEGWDYIKPLQRIAGYYEIEGKRHYISLDDQHALHLAHKQHTDGVFQFDTDLAKQILENGVTRFEDLLFYNAAGHPGPMASIPEAIKNRDDAKGTWRRRLHEIHPILAEILHDTYGIILWQEQLAAIWQRLGGFTSPEAQEARKAVAKKHTHKLKDIGKKWIDGSTPNIGRENAESLWSSMVSFGRYAFNKSHGVSYCLVAYRCLWLKAHFAPEWWSAVMSDCHPDKRVRYMSVARTEAWNPTEITYSGHHKPKEPARGVKFDTINISNLTKDFTVVGDVVNQGLISISGLGESACEMYAGTKEYNSIEEFIAPVASNDQNGGKSRANKTALERFIKLGAFKHLPGHKNAKALWTWYQYHHCSGKEMTALRREIKQKLLDHQGWTEERIKKEIVILSAQYKNLYPKKKLPKKITDFKPEPDESLKAFNDIITEGFSLSEVLSFQKDYLGYYVNNPLDMYDLEDGMDIQNAKRKILAGLFRSTKISIFVTEYVEAITKTGNPYAKVSISDGVSRALVMIWNTELEKNKSIQADMAYKMYVEYDQSRGIFTLAKNSTVKRLNTIEDKQ